MISSRLVTKVLLALLIQGLYVPLLRADTVEEVNRIEQQTGLTRYPEASVERFQRSSVIDHRLVTGSLKTVNSRLQIDDVQRISGELLQITYRIPDGYTPREVFDHYRTLVSRAEGRVLYECRARECGASSLWANQVFKVAELYGPDQHQYYQVALLTTEQGTFTVAFYSIQRGNRRVYLHLELMKLDSPGLADLSVNPQTLLATLRQDGHWVMGNLEFDEKNQLKADQSVLPALAAAMTKDVRLMIYLVGHLASATSMTTDELIAQSKARAESVKQSLVAAGIAAERIDVHGVGPLAPPTGDGQDSDRVEVVLRLR